MIALYYIIFVFGILLLLYTAKGWRKTSKKINSREASVTLISKILLTIKQKAELWQYYFVTGDKKKLPRNIIITFIVFLVMSYLNLWYIRLDRVVFCLLFGILFVILVWMWGKRRNHKMFTERFSEAIQILTSATSSGAGLLQALERCGKDLPGLLGEEFKNIHKRLAIGEDPISVFEDSYTRYPYKEFYFFIMIIRTNLAKGGQIREVISRLGRLIADNKKMEKKKKAMTSEARMSAMIVASFPVAFFLFMRFFMPDNFDFLINDASGRIVLYYVIGSETIGMLIIWWLMRKST
ncbi:tight adherence protein B [Cricetibacter osteomyelitidis]|uniref:Tight adherence protein B n=1 Tax=Cricetibacter osteomyelitidis TaxID=1521931 RepID=A0A4R2TC38_9PAST|nr:type II secretion system F family protein [Cricetibacter osteomyelitidis]TCP94658.1 tight adherence protein B [Cricetibacter osteomyelitidis]